MPAIVHAYIIHVDINRPAIQHFEPDSSMLSTQFSFQACAKSISNVNCTKMKRKAPIRPVIIHPKHKNNSNDNYNKINSIATAL